MAPSTLAPPAPPAPAPLATGSSDEALAARVAAGDRHALARLVSRHDRELRRMCAVVMRDEHAGGDAAQEAWLRAWTALGRAAEPPQRFLPWLRAIARNVCLDAMREGARCEPAELGEMHEGSAGPEELLEGREEARLVLGDLGDLPDRQRAAVVGSLEGLSHDQVAARLGVSRAQAGTLLSEGRRSLAQRRAGRLLSCSDVEAAVDGRAGRNRSVRAHLDSCPRCRASQRRARARALLARFPLPPWLWPFGERAGGVLAGGPAEAAAGSLGTAVAAVAAAIALAGSAGVALQEPDRSPAQPPGGLQAAALDGSDPVPALRMPAVTREGERDGRRVRRAPGGDATAPGGAVTGRATPASDPRVVAPEHGGHPVAQPAPEPSPAPQTAPGPVAGAPVPVTVEVAVDAGGLAGVDAAASVGAGGVDAGASLAAGPARIAASARLDGAPDAPLSAGLQLGLSE